MDLFEYIDILNQPYDIFTTTLAEAPMHWHYYCEILYVMEGSLKIIFENKTELLEKEEIAFIYPLQLHKVRTLTKDSRTKYMVLKFDIQALHIPQVYASEFRRFFTKPVGNDACCLHFHSTDLRMDAPELLLNNLVREANRKDDLYFLQIQSYLCTLLIGILRTLKAKQIKPEFPNEGHHFFFHILEYIDAHASEPLSIESLASLCHMSYSCFAKQFRETYGRSCKDYILYVRVLKAQEFLLNTDFDLDYIAQETGFYDASHFIRTYKKIKGITPKQERKAQQ